MNPWQDVGDGLTFFMHAPGGIIVRVAGGAENANGIALAESMTYVRCTQPEIERWLVKLSQKRKPKVEP